MQQALHDYRQQAAQCVMLAETAMTPEGREVLESMARDFDALATEHDAHAARQRPLMAWWHR